jgi:hypothetical protein
MQSDSKWEGSARELAHRVSCAIVAIVIAQIAD